MYWENYIRSNDVTPIAGPSYEAMDVSETTPEINPDLDMNLAMSLIFDRLSKKEWKMVRLVNKFWHTTLLPKWREEMVLQLGCERFIPRDIIPRRPETLTQTLVKIHPSNNPEDPCQLETYPYRNVRNAWCGYRLTLDQTRFFMLFGPGFKRINLVNIHITHGYLLKEIILEFTPNLEEFSYVRCTCDDIETLDLNTRTEYTPPVKIQPNLKFLTVKIFDETDQAANFDDECDYKPEFPISWLELFSACPNIEKLHLAIDPLHGFRPSDFLVLMKAIHIVRTANGNNVLNITELDTSEDTTELAHVDLVAHELWFTTLPISILNVQANFLDTQELAILVKTYKSTMTQLTLSLDKHHMPKNRLIHLPYDALSPKLTKLILKGPFFPSLELLAHTPELVEFYYEDLTNRFEYTSPRLLTIIPVLTHLTKLNMELAEEMGLNGLEILTKLMPNVKECVLSVVDPAFHLMCQAWPGLEHLDLEAFFTKEDFFLEHLHQLQNLKTLVLRSSFLELSDNAIFQGMLPHPCLRKLTMFQDAANFTQAGVTALQTKMSVTII